VHLVVAEEATIMDPHAKAPFDDETLHRLRGKLEQERRRLREALDAEARPREPFDQGEPADLADATNRYGGDEVAARLADRHREQLAAVERAIARMEAGTYGLDERTGAPIALERLEAMPWTSTS
jgi:DnaK suppressor protein